MSQEKKEKTLRAATYEEKQNVRAKAIAALEMMKTIEKRVSRKAKAGEYNREKTHEFSGYRVSYRPL